MSRKWEEEAAYFESHRNDPEEWDGPIEAPIVAPKNGLAISVTVRFSPEDAEAIRQTARLESKTYSEVVRAAAIRQTAREEGKTYSEVVSTLADRKREALTVTVAVRFSAPEAESLSETAKREGKTFSEIIRKAVHRYTKLDTVFQGNQEKVVPVFASQAPRTQGSALRDAFVFDHPPTGSRTVSSAAAD